MDQEYSAKGTEDPQEEAELRSDIERSGEHQQKPRKGEQDPEDRRGSQPNNENGQEEGHETVAQSNP
jgi:hypothetical protein